MTLSLQAYQEFLETMPDAAVIADGNHRIVFANAQAGVMFGHAAAALRGQPLSVLLPPGARAAHEASVHGFFERPRTRQMGAAGRYMLAQRADGSELPVDIMLRPLVIDGVRLALAVVRDVSERRRLETELREAAERERRLALTDHLTGAHNARAFVEAVALEAERLRRHGHAFSLCYIDLDHFKAVNDEFGHSVGDELLRVVVRIVSTRLRSADLLARLGGDELALLLPETGAAGALRAAEKVRADVAAAMVGRNWPVTLSMGVLSCEEAPERIDELIRAADALMYQAKTAGRNRVASGRYPSMHEAATADGRPAAVKPPHLF